MLEDPPLSGEGLAAREAAGLGEVGTKSLRRIEHDRQEIGRRDVKLEKLSFEIAQFRRLEFGKKSEQLDAEQRALFDEALDADIAAADTRLQELLGKNAPAWSSKPPKRPALARAASAGAVAKYVEHLPLYRLTAISGCAGIALQLSPLRTWIGICGLHLQPPGARPLAFVDMYRVARMCAFAAPYSSDRLNFVSFQGEATQN